MLNAESPWGKRPGSSATAGSTTVCKLGICKRDGTAGEVSELTAISYEVSVEMIGLIRQR